MIGCLVLGALIAEFAPVGLLTDGRESTPQLQPPAASVPVPATSEVAPTSSEPPATAPATVPTTLPPDPVASIEPLGDPLDLEQLNLGVDGIGELLIGDQAPLVLGRLAATFGQPDSDEVVVSDGTFSGCPGEEVRVVRWGTLAVTAAGPEGGRVFAGYRVDLDFAADAAGPRLATISGLRAGDTVADLERIYADLDLSYFEASGGPVFELRRQSDGILLLTGPLTGVDPASVVRGIYSPDLCA